MIVLYSIYLNLLYVFKVIYKLIRNVWFKEKLLIFYSCRYINDKVVFLYIM